MPTASLIERPKSFSAARLPHLTEQLVSITTTASGRVSNSFVRSWSSGGLVTVPISAGAPGAMKRSSTLGRDSLNPRSAECTGAFPISGAVYLNSRTIGAFLRLERLVDPGSEVGTRQCNVQAPGRCETDK